MNINDAENKLMGKGIDKICKKCNNVQMFNQEPVQVMLGSNGQFDSTITCAALICTNCGHLDMFVEEIFNK